jgi:hypothetical protein
MYPMPSVIIKKQCFGASFSLIVARTDSYGIDVAEVGLRLGMYSGVVLHIPHWLKLAEWEYFFCGPDQERFMAPRKLVLIV